MDSDIGELLERTHVLVERRRSTSTDERSFGHRTGSLTRRSTGL